MARTETAASRPDRRSQLVFSIAIAAASAIGLAKTLLVALVLQPADFGLYAALFGAAVMATTFLSFGRNERTMKAWPRAWEAGDYDFLLADGRQAMAVLLRRAVLAASLVCAAAALLGLGDVVGVSLGAGIALAGLLVVPGIAMLLTASGIRAAGSGRMLLAFTAGRTGAALLLVVPLAFLLGWEWALAGELVAQALVAAAGWAVFRRRCEAQEQTARPRFAETPSAIAEGRTFYASGLLGSIVPFGGRGIIAVLADAATAGSYAVAMTFVQIAQMFTAAVAQREGPQIIKLVHRGETAILGRLALPGFLVLVLAAGTLAGFAASLLFAPAQAFWDSYGLGLAAIALTAMAMLASFHLQLSFVMLAFDAERRILAGSAISAALGVGGFAIAAANEAGPAGYIMGVAAGETLRCLYLLWSYFRLRASLRTGDSARGGADRDAAL